MKNNKTFDSVQTNTFFSNLKMGFEAEFVSLLDYHEAQTQIHLDKIKTIANLYKNYTGNEITCSNFYHDYNRKNINENGQQIDHFEPDISIQTHVPVCINYNQRAIIKGKYRLGIELSSRTYNNFNSFFDAIQTTFAFLAQHKFFTNSSTGFHITLTGFPDDMEWRRFVIEYNTKKHLKLFNRQNNEFAKPRFTEIINNIKNNYSENEFHRQIRKIQTISQLVFFVNQHYIIDRHFDIHLRWNPWVENKKEMMVELRVFGNDQYHLRFDEIRQSFLEILLAIKTSYYSKWNIRKSIKKYFVAYQQINENNLDRLMLKFSRAEKLTLQEKVFLIEQLFISNNENLFGNCDPWVFYLERREFLLTILKNSSLLKKIKQNKNAFFLLNEFYKIAQQKDSKWNMPSDTIDSAAFLYLILYRIEHLPFNELTCYDAEALIYFTNSYSFVSRIYINVQLMIIVANFLAQLIKHLQQENVCDAFLQKLLRYQNDVFIELMTEVSTNMRCFLENGKVSSFDRTLAMTTIFLKFYLVQNSQKFTVPDNYLLSFSKFRDKIVVPYEQNLIKKFKRFGLKKRVAKVKEFFQLINFQ